MWRLRWKQLLGYFEHESFSVFQLKAGRVEIQTKCHCNLKLLAGSPCWTSPGQNQEAIPRADFWTRRLFWKTQTSSRLSASTTRIHLPWILGWGVFADSLARLSDFFGSFREFFCGGTEGPLSWISPALRGEDPAMQNTQFNFELFWVLFVESFEFSL